MKIAATLLSSALLASMAIAAPLTEQRRARRLRQSNPPLGVNSTEAIKFTDVTHPQFSSNWAGGVLIGSGFKTVTGTFTIPTPRIPSGGSTRTQFCASAWVGIDGDTCQTAILQTGLDFCVQGSAVSFAAWFEWFPDFAHDFTGITLAAGDSIKVTVSASSFTGGTATIKNNSRGQTVSHTFSGQPSLCQTNAEWIVEDFSSGNSLVPFANFGTVTFSGANAGGVGPSGATIIDMQQNGQTLTSVSVSGSSVTVNHL